MSTLLTESATCEAALEYASKGYKVFPCEPNGKKPLGKLVPHGVKDATDNPDTIRDWWAQDANIALSCEGLIVIDDDSGNTWPGAEKLELEDCPKASTPRGGRHYVFRRPEDKTWKNSTGKLADHIDTRTDGGYIVVEPSQTDNGVYRWDSELPLREDLPEPPKWLADELDTAFAPDPPALVGQSVALPLTSLADTIDRAKRYLEAMPASISGSGGHNAALTAAQALVNGFCLESETALTLLLERFNPSCEPPWTEAELRHKIQSAIDNPPNKPRGWLLAESYEARRDDSDVDLSGIMGTVEQEPKRPWVPFPVDSLPGPIRRLCVEGAASMNVDPSIFALPALVGAASAIGNQFRVQLKPDWSEPAILWGAIIADSGNKKTPALDKVVKPFSDMQAEAFEVAKAAKAENPDAPPPMRFMVSDITIEALAQRLEVAPYGLLVFNDELSGWLKGMGQYKGGESGDLSHWLSLYTANPLLVDRKTGHATVHVPHASVCIFGGIQRSIMAETITPETVDTGLIARLLLAMPPTQKDLWTDDTLSDAASAMWETIVKRLFELRNKHGESGNLTKPTVKLSSEAKRLWVPFYNRRAEAKEQETCHILRTTYPKLNGGAARLALVIHCLRWASGEFGPDRLFEIDSKSMAAGIALSDWFLNEAGRVYGDMLSGNRQSKQADLLEWIKDRGGEVTARDLMTDRRGSYPTPKAAKEALEELADMGWGTYEKTVGPKGGRPSWCFKAEN